MKMINKYWSNKKKIEWLNKHFESKSDRNWGRYWYYNTEDLPPYEVKVAYVPQETQGPDNLEVYYDEIKKYLNKKEEVKI